MSCSPVGSYQHGMTGNGNYVSVLRNSNLNFFFLHLLDMALTVLLLQNFPWFDTKFSSKRVEIEFMPL